MDNLLSSPKTKESSNTLKLAIFGSLIGLVYIAGVFMVFSGPKVSSSAMSQFEVEEQEFKNYINRYSKSYNLDQYLERFRVFRDNLGFIRSQNSLGNTWVLGVNQFTDLTPQEFKAKYLQPKIQVPAANLQAAEIPFVGTVPAAIDWRAQGAVTPVGTEGNCSCDYAFAAVGAVEGIWKISGNTLTVLSVQEIIDCSTGFYSNIGCSGGYVDYVYQFIQMKGITSA
ncbi:unnamed protein product [Blepharisma stoltei]|uniref:Cathepsin propeptide inhibitor domain-containing protein n=1 Tax=Blepharisma stoltei TaxID=1481888 RepID=A0AAU9INE8_9CILI|nr:unnamed protein product [Blepharisma stoltei]